MKLISITVPSYNVEAYLERTLNSFVHKDLLESLEILIINDGSSDKTEEIAKKFVLKYPETFFLFNKENGGHGSAVNTGIQHATGYYFKIVDGDDWVETENLVNLVNQLYEVETDLVLTDYQTVHMETGDIEKFLFQQVERCKNYTVSEILKFNQLFPMATVCYKTEILQKNCIRLQEKTFYVDEEFDVLPFFYVKNIYFSDQLIYNYLIGNINQSVHIQNQVLRLNDKKRVARRLSSFLSEQQDVSDNYQYCFKKVKGLIESIFLILLIFDSDKLHGKNEAASFYKEMFGLNHHLFKACSAKYKLFCMLNYFKSREKLYQIIRRFK